MSSSRWLPWLAWLIVLATAVRFACIVAPELAQPHDLLRESPQLATVKVLRAGLDAYSPAVYADVPFTLTVYTPLYFELVAALPELPRSPFLVGRLVSLLAMLAAVALLFSAPRRAGPWLPALAASAFLLIAPVSMHAAILRLDPLALFFSAGAVTLARRGTSRSIVAAALCALLAVATKQSATAGALACLLWLGRRDLRLALRFAACFFGGLLLALGAALLAWGRGFWFSTVVAVADPPQFGNLWLGWGGMLAQPIFAVLVALGVLAAASTLRREGLRGALGSLELCYVATATGITMVALLKNGASFIYFLEPGFALALWLVAAWPAEPGPRRALAFGALVLAAGFELATSRAHWSDICAADENPQADVAFAAAVRDRLARRGHEHPSVLNLGPPRYGYLFADDVSLNDYFLYTVLWETGRLSVEPLLAAIEARRFDVVLLTSAREQSAPVESWQRLEAAVRANYKASGQDALYDYFER